MTVSAKQNWTGTGTGSSVASEPLAFANVPIAGNLLVCYAELGNSGGTGGIGDDIGDSVSWSQFAIKANATEGVKCYGWWKVVGTPSGGGKTVTVSASPNEPISLVIAEYQSSVGGITWGLNGTAIQTSGSGSNPALGTISMSGDPSTVNSFISSDTAVATAGAGFTRQTTVTHFGDDAVEDLFTTGTSQAVAWVGSLGNWTGLAGAFKAATGAGGGSMIPIFALILDGLGGGRQHGNRLH